MKLQKGDANNVDDLNNIIAYENAVMMNYYANYDKEKSEKLKADHLDELF